MQFLSLLIGARRLRRMEDKLNSLNCFDLDLSAWITRISLLIFVHLIVDSYLKTGWLEKELIKIIIFLLILSYLYEYVIYCGAFWNQIAAEC